MKEDIKRRNENEKKTKICWFRVTNHYEEEKIIFKEDNDKLSDLVGLRFEPEDIEVIEFLGLYLNPTFY